MEDGELDGVGDDYAGKVLPGDYYELHRVMRADYREFDFGGVDVCGRRVGERVERGNAFGDDHDSGGFLYGDDGADVGGGVAGEWRAATRGGRLVKSSSQMSVLGSQLD